MSHENGTSRAGTLGPVTPLENGASVSALAEAPKFKGLDLKNPDDMAFLHNRLTRNGSVFRKIDAALLDQMVDEAKAMLAGDDLKGKEAALKVLTQMVRMNLGDAHKLLDLIAGSKGETNVNVNVAVPIKVEFDRGG